MLFFKIINVCYFVNKEFLITPSYVPPPNVRLERGFWRGGFWRA